MRNSRRSVWQVERMFKTLTLVSGALSAQCSVLDARRRRSSHAPRVQFVSFWRLAALREALRAVRETLLALCMNYAVPFHGIGYCTPHLLPCSLCRECCSGIELR